MPDDLPPIPWATEQDRELSDRDLLEVGRRVIRVGDDGKAYRMPPGLSAAEVKAWRKWTDDVWSDEMRRVHPLLGR